MDENLSSKLKSIENQLEILNKSIEGINYKVNQTKDEILTTKEEVKKAKRAANASDSNSSIWIVGIILMAILAVISNPSVSDHHAFLKDKGFNPDAESMKDVYKSYLIFSKIDSNGDQDGGTVTFGIFGNVFEGGELKKLRNY